MDATDVHEAVTRVRDAVSVRRVFGEPYEKNGLTVIPAARIWGGGGGGLQGAGEGAPGGGFGSGFGLMGRPSGAFVVRGDTVRWQPAVDPDIVVVGALLVVLLAVRAARRRRRRAMWARTHGAVGGPPGGMPGPPPPPPPPGAPHQVAQA